jgi:xanthine dehydrogenase molybdenum-binding subunit
VADCGTVIHPMGLDADQERRRDGLRLAGSSGTSTIRRTACRQHFAAAGEAAVYLDVPATMATAWVDIADPQKPARHEGHRRAGAGLCGRGALCAISDALGGHYFNRTPVVADMIVNAATGRPQSHKPLQVNTA